MFLVQCHGLDTQGVGHEMITSLTCFPQRVHIHQDKTGLIVNRALQLKFYYIPFLVSLPSITDVEQCCAECYAVYIYRWRKSS